MIRGVLAISLALLPSGCTTTGARITFVAGVAADAATTQYGLEHGAREANPIVRSAPVPILLGLAAFTVACAEIARKRGDESLARKLYLWGGAIHGAFAAWNTVQIQHGMAR